MYHASCQADRLESAAIAAHTIKQDWARVLVQQCPPWFYRTELGVTEGRGVSLHSTVSLSSRTLQLFFRFFFFFFAISTKYNCDFQLFPLNGVKNVSRNSGKISSHQ